MKNVIFDWSGVVSDDMDNCITAGNACLRALGLEELNYDTFRKNFTLPYMDFYKKLDPDADKAVIDATFKEVFSSLPLPEIFDGMKEVLVELKNTGYRLIVFSAHQQQLLEREVDEYGLHGVFEHVEGSVYDKRERISDLLRTHSFDPAETAYVGDMDHDVQAGKRAGVVTIAVTWGHLLPERLIPENPDYLVHSVSELRQLFRDKS